MVAVGIYAPEVDSRSFAILEQKRQKYPFLIFRDCQFAAFGAKNYVLEISGVTHKTKSITYCLTYKIYAYIFQRRRSRGAVGCPPVPRRCRGLTEGVTARAVSWQHRDQSRGIGPLTRSVGIETRAVVSVRLRGQVGSIETRAGVLVRSAVMEHRPEQRCRSATRTRFQLTPDAVRGWAKERHAPQGGAAEE